MESLDCGEETRAVARNLSQGLRSRESRSCSQVEGCERGADREAEGARGSRQGGAMWSTTCIFKLLSTWQGGAVLSLGPGAGKGHRLIRVREESCSEVLFSLGIIDC